MSYIRRKYIGEGINSSAIPVFVNTEQYANAKINILEKDFLCCLTEEDKQFIRSFRTQESIDRVCRKVLYDHLDRKEFNNERRKAEN